MMDTSQIIITVAFGVVLLAAIAQTSDFLKTKSNDRRKKTLSDSILNNRIVNAFDNVEYRVVSILEQEGGFFDWDGETVKSYSRTQRTFLNCHPDQFKEPLVESLRTGKHVYRFFPKEIIDVSNGASAGSTGYTNEELKTMSEQAFKDQIELKGKIARLEANIEEKVDDRIGDVNKAISPKYPGN